MNDRLCAVMTISAQQFNICSLKYEREYGAFRPLVTRLATVMAIWFCPDPFVASANP